MGRAPMLDSTAAIAGERMADPRYKGEATDSGGYIYESMVKPSAFVVAGFGKAGTNDEEGPFSILGNIYVDEPDGIGDTWVSDSSTANTIRWEIAGKVDNVDILSLDDGLRYVKDSTLREGQEERNTSQASGNPSERRIVSTGSHSGCTGFCASGI